MTTPDPSQQQAEQAFEDAWTRRGYASGYSVAKHFWLVAWAQGEQRGMERAIAVWMNKHNVPRGRCEDDDGQIVCGCEQLAADVRAAAEGGRTDE